VKPSKGRVPRGAGGEEEKPNMVARRCDDLGLTMGQNCSKNI
jgi:hypothetical protein